MKSFYRLDKQFNPIVIEGAGSISEINLWDRDIPNMRVACEVNADTYLVADIDRGGVFASVYGTLQLLPPKERHIVIIPGTKNTIKDLIFLREHGLARKIIEMFDAGKQIYGICGGYQMMGREVRDPYHIEGENQMMPGLGILPEVSTILKEKRTQQCEFTFMAYSLNLILLLISQSFVKSQ
jgi:cobyric acid synthase